MTFIRNVVISLCCLLLSPALSRAESWRGIVPLRSTRNDVEQRLGKPSEATDKLLTYRLENETALISLITSDMPGINPKTLRPGTVLDIEVRPRQTFRASDLGVDEKRMIFIKGSKPEFIGFLGYVDKEAGLIINSRGGTSFYFANAKDRAKCPTCSIDPQSIADVPICILCPTVAVTCPSEVKFGERAMFAAVVTSGLMKETFNWTVTEGTIVDGQGTPTITVDTTGIKSAAITATVEVGGIDLACNRKASCSTPVPNVRPINH